MFHNLQIVFGQADCAVILKLALLYVNHILIMAASYNYSLYLLLLLR